MIQKNTTKFYFKFTYDTKYTIIFYFKLNSIFIENQGLTSYSRQKILKLKTTLKEAL